MNKKLITIAIQTAIMGGALSLAPQSYAADDKEIEKPTLEAAATEKADEQKIQEKITVTGSRLRRDSFSVATPLAILGRDSIEDTGLGSLSEILVEELPQISEGSSNSNSQSSVQNTGLSTIDLRDLGTNRTLTLIDGRRTVSNSYSGNYVSLSTIPSGMVKRVEVITGETGGATDDLNIKFDKGVSLPLTLKYREAGVIKWQVTDPNYTFEKIQSSGTKRRLTKSISINGVLGINSRPWTFAICPLTFNGKNKYDNASGTSNGGEAYTAAGKPFDIVAKPLIWQIGDPDSESAMVDVSEQTYCNRPVTQNFFAKDAPSLNTGVTLSNGGLDSPNNGQKGVFSSQPQTDNSQQEFNGLLIADNSWSEVGSLWVNANLTNYLGMTVNSSKRHIGRFFPAYFGLTHNQLTPAMTSFTYMGQPFPVHWTVNAFNQQGKALDNYDQFAETLTAKFGFVVKNNNGGDDQRLLLQDPVPEKWTHNAANSHSYINYQSNVTYARKGFLSTPLITSPDGPDELWQLWLNLLNPSENRPIDSPRLLTSELCSSKNGCTNPTVQKVISLRIGNQNPMRYGRMALQDAAGDIGKPLTIPLRVEYWNGAEFVTNSDDSASTFDGANYCRQILIQEPVPHTPNNPTTSGAGTVNLGQPLLSQLMANPDGDFKQQIRFWQRLSALTKPTQIAKTPKIKCENSILNQPWLSFNWRGLGDEDPSATVTFGVYHGNNRIIYRGEANAKDLSIPYRNYQ
jgi:hypothetical protein